MGKFSNFFQHLENFPLFFETWRFFFELGAVDGDEKAFKAEFLEEIQQEVSREMAISHLFDSLNIDLNKPISEDEVDYCGVEARESRWCDD